LIAGLQELGSLAKEELQRGSERVVVLNSVLESVGEDNPRLLEQFRGELDGLSSSRNIAIRDSAARLVGIVDRRQPIIRRVPRELPAIYELDVPVLRISVPGRDSIPEPGEALPDSNDPRLVVRPFNEELSIIASAAHLAEGNVLARVVQIMYELRPFSEWSAAGEGRVRRILESADLKLAFVRPRTALVRRAMFHLVAELYDGGVFDSGDIQRLDPVLRYYDSSLSKTGANLAAHAVNEDFACPKMEF
jgi:hypothetical protein